MQESQPRLMLRRGVAQQSLRSRPQGTHPELRRRLVRGETELPHVGIHRPLIVLPANEAPAGDVAEEKAPTARGAAVEAARAQRHAVQKALMQRGVKVTQRELPVCNIGAGVVPGLRLVPRIVLRRAPFEPQLVARCQVAEVGAGQLLARLHRCRICQSACLRCGALFRLSAVRQHIAAQCAPPTLPRTAGSAQGMIRAQGIFCIHAFSPGLCCSCYLRREHRDAHRGAC